MIMVRCGYNQEVWNRISSASDFSLALQLIRYVFLCMRCRGLAIPDYIGRMELSGHFLSVVFLRL